MAFFFFFFFFSSRRRHTRYWRDWSSDVCSSDLRGPGTRRPAELATVRQLLPDAWFLVPGYGAQGGSAADVAAAFRPDGLGAVVNSSRGIRSEERRVGKGGGSRGWRA